MDSRLEKARVPTEKHGDQSTLFPLSDFSRPPLSPRDLCDKIGLNWLSAVNLFQGGSLSFDPRSVEKLSAAQEAELRLLGRLVAAGCDESMLKKMLAGLDKPYAYRLDRLYYDWESRAWDILPTGDLVKEKFEAWLEELVESGQLGALENMRAGIDSSIRELRRTSPW
jgi:hypothetical protein